MRFHHILDRVFGKKTNIKVLRFFVLRGKEASIREISREIKAAPPNVSKSLKDLNSEGILSIKIIGRSHVYSLNTENLFVKYAIVPLFLEEGGVIDRLKSIVLPAIKFPFESLVLFGSIARGDESAKSDIDLAVIIGPKISKQRALDELLSLSSDTSQKLGNQLSPVIYHAKEFASKYKKNTPLIREICKEGIVLAGKSLNEIILNLKYGKN